MFSSDSVSNCYWRLVFVTVLSLLQATDAGTASMAAPGSRYPRRLMQHKAYLPPFDEQNSLTYTTQTLQETSAFRTQPQLLGGGKRTATAVFNSYMPPASGQVPSFQYSAPQASQSVQLPALPPLLTHNAPQNIARTAANQRVLMIEEPIRMYLTPNQNRTLEAARFLANSLLVASGEQPLAPENVPSGLLVHPDDVAHNPQKLNRTDVVIVKAQKNAYIIPNALAAQVERESLAGKSRVQSLYEMRNQLDKAYTINQFIFIIKPDKINFLNKLV